LFEYKKACLNEQAFLLKNTFHNGHDL